MTSSLNFWSLRTSELSKRRQPSVCLLRWIIGYKHHPCLVIVSGLLLSSDWKAANGLWHTGYFIYLNWLPSYFNKVLGVNLRSSALLSFLPWLVMAIGCSAAGVIADKQVSSGRFFKFVNYRVDRNFSPTLLEDETFISGIAACRGQCVKAMFFSWGLGYSHRFIVASFVERER